MRREPRPPADPHLAGLFASRGRLHADRYLQTRDSTHLEDAISTMRTAVALAKESQSDVLGSALGNLAALLLEQAKSTGNDAILNEALQLATWALDCFADRDPDHVLILAILGSILASQYDRSGRVQDLEDAISSLETAAGARLPASLDDGPFPAVVSSNLSCVLGKRYQSSGKREDLNDAIAAALKATEVESTNPPMMAGIGLNLASLLATQYESTGALESLANSLFELRIVAEFAPESPDLVVLLGQLSILAKGQHELRAQPTTETRGVSQLTPSKSLTLFVLLSLSPVLSVVYPPAIYTLVLFLGGVTCNWAVQRHQRRTSKAGGSRYLLRSAPTWGKKLSLLPDSTSRFAPILFSTPWIDVPTTSAWTGDEELFAGDRPWRQKFIHSTHFEAETDQGDNETPSTSFSQQVSVSTSSHKAQGCDFVINSQKQELSYNVRDAGVGNDVDEPPKNQRLSSQGSDHGGNIIGPEDADNCVPDIPTTQIVTLEDVNNVEISPSTEASRVSKQTKILPDEVSTSTPPVVEAPIPLVEQDSTFTSTRKGLPSSKKQKEKPQKQDESSLAKPNPIDVNRQTPEKQGTTDPPHEKTESIEGAHDTLGKDFIDGKVHSRKPPSKIDKESSAFETVAQGHTENDINKNEGNAMGNIYSEEANVVGHLSRHYGDRFEMKNISAVVRGYQNPEAKESLPDGTSDQLHSEDIPQQVIDEYIRGLGERPEIEQPDKNQTSTSRVDKHERDDLRGDRVEPRPKGPDEDSRFREEKWNIPYSPVDSTIPMRVRPQPNALRTANGFPASSPTRRNTRGGVRPAQTESDLDSYSSDRPRVTRSATTSHKLPLPPEHPKYHGVTSSDHFGSDGNDNGLSMLEILHRRPRQPRPETSSSRNINERSPKTKTSKAPDSKEQDHHIPGDYTKQALAQEYISRSRGLVPPSSNEPTRARTTTSSRSRDPVTTRAKSTVERGHPLASSFVIPRTPDLRRYRTPYEQLRALSTYYNKLRPLCRGFVNNIPQDPKIRDLEYEALSETILQQLLLKADGIEASGDEHTRIARRTLIAQAHASLKELDEAVLGSR